MTDLPRIATQDDPFERIVQRYGVRVQKLAYLQVGDRNLAEDIAQDVFQRVWTNLNQFRGDSELETWIYRITVNRCRDLLRTPWYRRRHLHSPFLIEADGRQSGSDLSDSISQRDLVIHALAELKDRERQVVLLHYYLDLDLNAVSRVMGISEGAVRGLLYRARAKLRIHLEGEMDDEA